MHTIGYPPHRIGGTEVHVRDLAEALGDRSVEVDVSWVRYEPEAPAVQETAETLNGVRVHTIHAPLSRREWASDDRDPLLRDAVARSVRRAAPDLVHLHPLHPDSIVGIAEALARHGPVVTSYHTATLACPRGSLLRNGATVCDGVLRQRRCCACVLQARGLPRLLAGLLSLAPAPFRAATEGLPSWAAPRRARSMFRLPGRVARYRGFVPRLWEASRGLIVVADWMRDLLVRTGAPARRIRLIRYGRRLAPPPAAFRPGACVRFGYLGRLTAEKGLPTLVDAIRILGGEARFRVEFVSPAFDRPVAGSEDERWADRLRGLAADDARVVVRGGLAPDRVTEALAEWDALLLPSIATEMSPQVIVEAFHARTPVIGTARGGVPELVEEGRTGYLFPAGDANALAAVMRRLAADPQPLRSLRDRIPRARTSGDMASETLRFYEEILRGKI
jgi:glycosyltransferase involved in cell wall biosynthesis